MRTSKEIALALLKELVDAKRDFTHEYEGCMVPTESIEQIDRFEAETKDEIVKADGRYREVLGNLVAAAASYSPTSDGRYLMDAISSARRLLKE